jgi:hypothetical protein
MTDCKQPNWNSILEKCKEKIELKYPEYGNSWVDDFFFDWKSRLQGEVNEVEQYSDLSQEEKIAELIDVINICAMRITNLQSIQYHEMRMSRYS